MAEYNYTHSEEERQHAEQVLRESPLVIGFDTEFYTLQLRLKEVFDSVDPEEVMEDPIVGLQVIARLAIEVQAIFNWFAAAINSFTLVVNHIKDVLGVDAVNAAAIDCVVDAARKLEECQPSLDELLGSLDDDEDGDA